VSPRVRRTLAILAVLVIAAVVIVVWRTPLATTGPASADVEAVSTRPQRIALSTEAPALHPDVAPTELSVSGESRETRQDEEASQWKVRVDLTVHVTTPTGSLDERLRDQVRSRLFDRYGNHQQSRIRNDECSFPGLWPGKVIFTFLAPGYRPVERWITLRADEPTHREEVVLEPAWSLTVHLLTTDLRDLPSELYEIQGRRIQLIHPLQIVVSVDPPGQPTEMKHVMKNEWILSAHSGDLKLDLLDDPPVHASVFLGSQLLATQRLDTRVQEVTFTIAEDQLRSSLSGLTCQLVDQYTHGPIEGVKAMLVSSRGVHVVIPSDSQGVVRFPPQAPGVYRLDLEWEDRFLSSYTVQLEAGKTTDLGTISLSSGVEISGRFSDGDEKPDRAWSAYLVADDLECGVPNLLGPVRQIHVSLGGRFKTWGFAAGCYVLGAYSYEPLPEERVGRIFGVAKRVVIDTRSGSVRDLEIRMEDPVHLSVRPTFPDFEDYEFVLRSSDGLRCGGGFGGCGGYLTPGSYVLTLVRGREVLIKIPFTAGSGSFVLDVP
jgi:hypothetical protein